MNYPLKVSFVVLNWNKWHETVECLESIFISDYPTFEVIVVDNGSTNDSVKELRSRFKSIIVIETGDNLGFAGGCNVGIECALKNNSDYIFLLNNDAIIEKGALTDMINLANSDTKIGIVSPKIYFFNNSLSMPKIWYGGANLNLKLGRTSMAGYKKFETGQFDATRVVNFVSGCAMLVRSEVIRNVGMFDIEFFNIFEDADFCTRVSTKGYKLVYYPSAVVHHKESASFGTLYSPFSVYFQVRNRLLFIKKHVNKSFIPLAFTAAIISFLKRGIICLANKEFKSLLAINLGFFDYFSKQFGKGSSYRFN